MTRPLRIALLCAIALHCTHLIAAETKDPSRLTVQRIFGAHEFEAEQVTMRWLEGDDGYTTLEPSAGPSGGRDIVRHDPKTAATAILVHAELLVPPGAHTPLGLDDYAFSGDRSRLLIYTNSQRVWRTNSRGDYWVFDRTSHELQKLGGDAPAASLMHAKFSPDGSRVAYVRSNNIYVEDLREHRIKRLTGSTSADLINGTFDWVYEEEFSLRDGFRWSPDGNSIAYWQLDTTGVREFPLVNNIDSLYPRINPIKYPKVGETNAACRVGVVSAAGGETRWMKVAGDPRNHYLAFMEWAGDSDKIVLQQFNRHQNTVNILVADADSGQVATILTEHDDAWIDQQEEMHWIHDNKEFLWQSERDGWRHIYKASRTGGEPRLITAGDYDVIELLAVDEKLDWVYYIASPNNPTQRYLFRVHTDGTGQERVTPTAEPGTHS
jgi:dipeptidyl-peptidase 4